MLVVVIFVAFLLQVFREVKVEFDEDKLSYGDNFVFSDQNVGLKFLQCELDDFNESLHHCLPLPTFHRVHHASYGN